MLSTYPFPGSSLNTSATVGVPATSVHSGGFSSFALKGTTSGLVDNIDNGTHAASLTIQYSASVSQAIPSGLCGGDGAASHASKVMVIYEENRQYNQVVGSSNAPYINNTIKTQCALATNFTSRASGGHSLANYVESTDAQRYEGLGPPGTSAGSSTNSLCTNNCISQTSCAMGQTAPCWTVGTPDVVPGSTENATTGYFPVPPGSYDNLYNQQGSSGWKAYGESMPSNCFIASAGGDSTGDAYHPRHIPALYYTNLNGGSTFSGTNCNSGGHQRFGQPAYRNGQRLPSADRGGRRAAGACPTTRARWTIWPAAVSRSTPANLIGYRSSSGASIINLYVSQTGKLALRNNIGSVTTTSATAMPTGAWHQVVLHVLVNGTASTVNVSLDGTPVSDLSLTGQNMGTDLITSLQLGDTATARTYDIDFDDVAVSPTSP